MITAHESDSLTFHDGDQEYHVPHAAFVPMQPHADGGLHPSVTEAHQTYVIVHPEKHPLPCPVPVIAVAHPDPATGRVVTLHYARTVGWLVGRYGPEPQQIGAVPINGDVMAQRLHWVRRTDTERAEMKALLLWMGAWRLADDGTVPREGPPGMPVDEATNGVA